MLVVADPVARALEPVGFLAFEPVALVDLAVVGLLVAPVNVALGVALGALVTAFELLVPIAALGLLASLLYVGRSVDPTLAG